MRLRNSRPRKPQHTRNHKGRIVREVEQLLLEMEALPVSAKPRVRREAQTPGDLWRPLGLWYELMSSDAANLGAALDAVSHYIGNAPGDPTEASQKANAFIIGYLAGARYSLEQKGH